MTASARTAARDLVWQFDTEEPVLSINLLPDGAIIGGSEGTIVVADFDGRPAQRLMVEDFLLALAASPDGTRLAVGGGKGLAVFDLADGSVLAEHPHRWCGCLAWSADSRRLAANDGRLVQVHTRDGALRWTSPPLQSTVAGLAWMRADGRRLAAAAYQGVKIFEPDTDRIVSRLPAPGAIAGIAVAPNGRWVVGGSQDATLHGWNVRDGSDFRMSGFPKAVSRIVFEPSGRWMSCDGGDTVVCWDFSGAGPTGREAVLAEGHRDDVTALTWAPIDGSASVLVSGDAAGDLKLWRLKPGHRPGQRIGPSWSAATGDPVGAVAATADRIVSGHRSGAVCCFHPETHQQAG
jgi:WD40 repeat protein